MAEFSEEMCTRISEMAVGFSFALLKEVFASAMLASIDGSETATNLVENRGSTDVETITSCFDDRPFFKIVVSQINILRQEMDSVESKEVNPEVKAGRDSVNEARLE